MTGTATCREEPWACLIRHVGPKLDKFKASGKKPGQYRALCPAHLDRDPSLSIGVGNHQRIVWQCHAGCDDRDVRSAMVRNGVPDECLPRIKAQRTEDELVSALVPVLESGPSPARWLELAAIVLCGGKMPQYRTGQVALGLRAGMCKSTLYRLTRDTDNSRSGTSDTVSDTVSGGDTVRVPERESSPRAGIRDTVLTSGFGANRVAGVGTGVVGVPRGLPAPRLCEREGCGEIIEGRSAKAKYHDDACKSKAARVRRAARPPPGRKGRAGRE